MGRQGYPGMWVQAWEGGENTVAGGERRVQVLFSFILSLFLFSGRGSSAIFAGRRGKEPAGETEATTDKE